MLSLSDIRTVVDPLAENYFSLHSKPRLTDIYEEIFSFANGEMQSLVEDLEKKVPDRQTAPFRNRIPPLPTGGIGEGTAPKLFPF